MTRSMTVHMCSGTPVSGNSNHATTTAQTNGGGAMMGEQGHDDHAGGLPLGAGAVAARDPHRRAQAAPTRTVGLVAASHDTLPAVSGEVETTFPRGSGHPTGLCEAGGGSGGGDGVMKKVGPCRTACHVIQRMLNPRFLVKRYDPIPRRGEQYLPGPS